MCRASGSSLIELLAVIALVGVAVAATAVYLHPIEAPLQVGSAALEGYFRQARGRALATTSAYKVSASTPRSLQAQYANDCAETNWTPDPKLQLQLPPDVALASTSWSVCFNSRGLADANLQVTLNHPEEGSQQVEVLRGGASRVMP
jgi:hypothetical protein